MISFPNEIIGQIFDALDEQEDILDRHRDVRNLRLTCKTLADLGARNLFEEVSVASVPRSTEKFFKIAEHSTYRQYVKRIYYDGVTMERLEFAQWENQFLLLPDDVCEDDFTPPPTWPDTLGPFDSAPEKVWVEASRKWNEKHDPKHFYTEEQKLAAFSAYRNALSSQEEYERDDNRFFRLQAAFAQLPNLQEIKLVGGDAPDEINEPHMYTYDQVIMCDVAMRLPYDGVSGTSESQHHEFILRTLGHEDVKVKAFAAYKILWRAFDETFGTIPLSVESPPSFTHLKRIYISFYEPWWWINSDSKVRGEEMLGSLLRQARDLEDLSLRFGEAQNALEYRFQYHDLAPMRWEQIVRNNTWPRLKKLSLRMVDMTEKHTASFMRRHSSTLKDLDLADIFLLQGTWDSTFRQFKKALNLEKVMFKGIFGVSDPGTLEFDPEFHLPMREYYDQLRNRLLDLGTKEALNTVLTRYFLKEGNDADPLKYWGHGVLPEGVVWEDL